MPSGSRVALGVVGIAMGGLVVVGSLAGTLAAALAGLFDPSILEPATQGSGGIPLIPGDPGGRPGGGEPGSEPGRLPGAPSSIPIEPPGSIALPGGGNGLGLPSGGGGALPEPPSLPELPAAIP